MSTILGSLPKPDENVVVLESQSNNDTCINSSVSTETSKKSSKLKKKVSPETGLVCFAPFHPLLDVSADTFVPSEKG